MFLLTATTSTTTTATGTPITATDAFTTMHLILIAVLIVLVIVAILWGMRRKRERIAGEREETERTEALLAHPQTETAVSPAPPPLGDAGVKMPPAVAPKATKSAPTAALTPQIAVDKPARAAPAAEAPATPAAKLAPAPAAKDLAVKSVTAKAVTKAPSAKPAIAAPEVASAPKSAARPKSATAVTPAGPASSVHRLIDIKGLGPKAVPLLAAQGVATLSDLAGLSTARAAEIDAGLGALRGRMARDRWIEQANLLAAGKVAEFEAAYGKL